MLAQEGSDVTYLPWDESAEMGQICKGLQKLMKCFTFLLLWLTIVLKYLLNYIFGHTMRNMMFGVHQFNFENALIGQKIAYFAK